MCKIWSTQLKNDPLLHLLHNKANMQPSEKIRANKFLPVFEEYLSNLKCSQYLLPTQKCTILICSKRSFSCFVSMQNPLSSFWLVVSICVLHPDMIILFSWIYIIQFYLRLLSNKRGRSLTTLIIFCPLLTTYIYKGILLLL